MNYITYYIWKGRKAFCKRYHITHIFKTGVGVKGVYGISGGQPRICSPDIFYLEPSELYLGLDYLKDKYTLLGREIRQSPHYLFMKAIQNKMDLSQTDYIRRYESGTLDWRIGVPKHRSFKYYYTKYQEREKELNNRVSPVLVYKIDNNYYVFDGKHRAALCALNNIPIACQLVNVELFGGSYELIKDDVEYSLHHQLHEKYYSSKI